MFLAAFFISVAAAAAAARRNSPLPTVDLGYTLQQATTRNVSIPVLDSILTEQFLRLTLARTPVGTTISPTFAMPRRPLETFGSLLQSRPR